MRGRRSRVLPVGWLICGWLICAASVAVSSQPAGAVAPSLAALTSSGLRLKGENLLSASCTSSRTCTAAGSYISATRGRVGFVLTESKGAWRAIRSLPLPPAGGSSGSGSVPELSGISCTSPTACVAIGSYTPARGAVLAASPGVMLTEEAGAWSTTLAPLPSNVGTAEETLQAVSCATDSACTVVGSYRSNTGHVLGRRQHNEPSCPPAHRIRWKVDGGRGLVAHRCGDGTGAASGSALDAVACPAPGVCTAVGTYVTASGIQQGLILSESNGRWTAATTPLPSDGDGVVALDGISCPTIGSCMAVGSYDDDGTPVGLLLTEVGGTWLASTPPAGLYNGLYAIACPVTTDCISVGVYLDPTLAQHGVVLTGPATHLAPASAPLPTGTRAIPDPVSG